MGALLYLAALSVVWLRKAAVAISSARRSGSSFMKFRYEDSARLLRFSAHVRRVLAAPSLEPPKLRLDGSAQPLRYAVDLTIVPDRDTFHGSVDISVDVRTPAEVIWLNAIGLQIQEAELSPGIRRRAAGEDRAGRRSVHGLLLRSRDFRQRRSARRLSGQDQPQQQRRCFPVEGRSRMVRLQPVRTHRRPPRVSLFR